MPELPEMETYRRLLNEKISGKQITEIQVHREKSLNVPFEEFTLRVKGKKIDRVERRAKHLLFFLKDEVLLLHLMLGGWMFYGTEFDKPNRTSQVILTFGEKSLYFLGLRLGYLHLYKDAEVEPLLGDLGPEPLSEDFILPWFLSSMQKKRGGLKQTLVDQKFIAGIGNCYSDEICFHAAILPTHKIIELEESVLSQLFLSIRHVLSEAVKYGGYMESPFFTGDQLTGGFDPKCKVYDREGKPCVRCGHPIIKDEIASRKTFYCTQCQK